MLVRARNLFIEQFELEPEASASARGRVNLLGDHTDYNGGWALPSLLREGIEVAISAQSEPGIVATSQQFGVKRRPLAAPASQGDWLDYVHGCLELFAAKYQQPKLGLRLALSSNLPVGSGLSSSAALSIAVLRALGALYKVAIDDLDMALLAQEVEHRYVGLRCGLMDQLAVACGSMGNALLINCSDNTHRSFPMPANMLFAVIHSGSDRKLSASGYNQRRQLCEQSAQKLGYPDVSNASSGDIAKLSEEAALLVRHVVGENDRTLQAAQALAAADSAAMAELMTASHQSLRDLYRVSSPELEAGVAAALESGALAARLTGAGFGGCIVALLAPGQKQAFADRWGRAARAGRIIAWLS